MKTFVSDSYMCNKFHTMYMFLYTDEIYVTNSCNISMNTPKRNNNKNNVCKYASSLTI